MEDFDVREFAKMFDAALASDNSSVKKALRNFMMIAAIVHAEEGDERSTGPLETLVKKVGDLERMVYEIHTKQMTEKSYRDYYKDYLVNNPTWTYAPNTSTTSDTTWKNSVGYTAQDLSELLKDLKI